MRPIVRFERLTPTAKLPTRATPGSAGLDVHADVGFTMKPGEILAVSTGLRIALPVGFEGQVRPRSGLALKGITVINGPGTVDADFRGELKVLLVNRSAEYANIAHGERVAQLVVQRVEDIIVEEAPVDPFETARGGNGFGSTGH